MINFKRIEHTCEKICSSDRYTDEYVAIRSFNGTWVFHRFHYACEQCVYDGEAQYEGELLSVFDVAINFCPYCGLLLNKRFENSSITNGTIENKSEHTCSELISYNKKFPHVGYSFDTDAVWKINLDDGAWFLAKHSRATARMVLDDEATKDALVFWAGTTIIFCPFCGLSL